MKNGVLFGDKHSIKDWNLLMTSKNIEEAPPRTNYVKIEGRDGSIDLTEALGDVKYDSRTLSFTFEVFAPIDYWKIKREMSNYLNGRKMKIILDQDPLYYYYGRLEITSANFEKNVGEIKIEAVCDPYKMMNDETVVSKTVKAEDKFTLYNQRKTVMPVIQSTGNIVFKFNNKQFSISDTTNYQSPDFILKEGKNEVEIISGTGTLNFTYREGSL